MIRTLLLGSICWTFLTTVSLAQWIVSPGPPSNPENWISFTLTLPEGEWTTFDGSPGPESIGAIVAHKPENVFLYQSTPVLENAFWVTRSLGNFPSIDFIFRRNERFGGENTQALRITSEIDAGFSAYNIDVGPITEISWNGEVSSTRREFTVTGPNGYVRFVPEPSSLALVASAALGAYRRRR